MLTARQRKFCEAYAVEKNAAAAYRAAYPKSSVRASETGASRLLKNAKVRAEIDRIYAEAQKQPGGAVLTLAKVHDFLARVVEARPAALKRDSDLWQSIKESEAGSEYRLPDKLAAIARWCDLQGEGSEAGANDVLGALLERVMR